MRSLHCLACVVIAATARANTYSTTVVIPPTGTSWNTTVNFTKWDPANGQLNSITFTLTAEIQGFMTFENTGASAITLTSMFAAFAYIARPDLSVIDFAQPSQTFVDSLSAFDGTIDARGTSGVTHAGILAASTTSSTSPPPVSDLLLFQGPQGNPGTITLPVIVQDISSWGGHTLAQVTQSAKATITLTYDYTPPPITAFCFGDGLGTPCPCGNSGMSGNGCAASYNAAGANLSWSGTPSVLSDSFTLLGAGTSSAPILYFQSTAQHNGGLGSAFGDGLLCTSGATVRLGLTISSAGLSQYPFGVAPPISIQGVIPTGGGVTRYYQAYFRDSASYCGPATFNLTNALAVPWLP